MSTRANIVQQLSDGTCRRIYTHFDGYVEHHGPILLGHYNTDEAVAKLIELGDVSRLCESCEKPPGHSYDNPVPGYTVYYGRDRGEEGTGYRTFPTIYEAISTDTGDYVYVWSNVWSNVGSNGRQWHVYHNDKLCLLKECMDHEDIGVALDFPTPTPDAGVYPGIF